MKVQVIIDIETKDIIAVCNSIPAANRVLGEQRKADKEAGITRKYKRIKHDVVSTIKPQHTDLWRSII